LNVSELIGEYLKLEKAGTNYKALCPFHNEKTPSFMVNAERNFWYCFGCQKGGDIFSFLMEIEGLEFREALERLAERTSVELPKFKPTDPKIKNQKEKLYEILELSCKFYQYQLEKSKKAQPVKDYLKKRKIKKEQFAEFRIGFARPGWRNLLEFLLSREYNLADISHSGLVVQRDGTSGASKDDYYDRFRERIMFPVIDVVGKVVGYSARMMPGGDESSAKYVNTSQSPIYDKSRVIYGLSQAKLEIKKQDFVIIVEGNLDVIASFSAGVKNVVAVSGTALTEEQINIIKRYTKNFKLCFDMDEAGQKAVAKSIQMCLSNNLETEIILLPKGFKDVNDLVIKDVDLWKKAVENSRQVMDYFFNKIVDESDKDSPKGKKKIAHKLLNIIKDISDPIEQSYWLRKLSEKLDVQEDVLTEVLERVKIKENKLNQKNKVDDQKREIINPGKSKLIQLQERILGLAVLFPKQLKKEIEIFEVALLDELHKDIWNKILAGKTKKISDKLGKIETEIKYTYNEDGVQESEINPTRDWESVLKKLKILRSEEDLSDIIKDIKKAEENEDEEILDSLMEDFSKISKKLYHLKTNTPHPSLENFDCDFEKNC
jgi:DNA primase